MRTFIATATALLMIVLMSAPAMSAEPTEVSKAAKRLQYGMHLDTVVSILGVPDWVILKSDSGKYSLHQPPDTPEDKKAAFELLWRNKNCTPVSVYFTKYFKAVGWDMGLRCGENVETELPEKYSCDQPDRSRYCRQ